VQTRFERFGPGVELGFRDAVADLDVLGRVVSVGRDAAHQIGQLFLIPLDLLGQIGRDADVAVIEMHNAGVLAHRQTQLVGTLGVLVIQRAIDVIDDGLGVSQQIGRVVLQLNRATRWSALPVRRLAWPALDRG
jgi:hypothetical protein